MTRKYKPLFLDNKIKYVCIKNLKNEEHIKNALLTANPYLKFTNNDSSSEVDLVICDMHKPIPSSVKNKKEIMQISSLENFYTKSQIELNISDWEVIRELEKLLPSNHDLVIKRNNLRNGVDNEINEMLAEYEEALKALNSPLKVVNE